MAKIKLYTFYIDIYGATTKYAFKIASLVAVTWMPSLKLCHTKSQRSEQVYHRLIQRETYYSSQVNRVCIVSVYK